MIVQVDCYNKDNFKVHIIKENDLSRSTQYKIYEEGYCEDFGGYRMYIDLSYIKEKDYINVENHPIAMIFRSYVYKEFKKSLRKNKLERILNV
jgi:hypothetical protein